jgi:hypothetical protein
MATTKSRDASAMSRTMDFRGFIFQLDRVAGDGPMAKARALLREEGFLVGHEATDEQLVGVVRAGAAPPRVHACKIDHTGSYMCCTSDLEACAALQGKPCEHLLGLILLLAQVGAVDATMVSTWVRRAVERPGPELDRDAMSAALAKLAG